MCDVGSHPFDLDTMLFMDWRDDHTLGDADMRESNQVPLCAHLQSRTIPRSIPARAAWRRHQKHAQLTPRPAGQAVSGLRSGYSC